MKEQEIIQLILQRNEKGIEELLKHYGALMRYIITPILQNPQDQEECLSEVTMKVWNKMEQFNQQRGSWNAWLTAVTRNTALNYTRTLSNHNSVEEIPKDMPSLELTPEEKVMQKERQDTLNHTLEQLHPKERMLFYRKYYYLQSTAQIASELGMSERAVEGKLYRLKKKLRKMLGGE